MFSKAGVTEDSIVIFYISGKDSKDFGDAASTLGYMVLKRVLH